MSAAGWWLVAGGRRPAAGLCRRPGYVGGRLVAGWWPAIGGRSGPFGLPVSSQGLWGRRGAGWPHRSCPDDL